MAQIMFRKYNSTETKVINMGDDDGGDYLLFIVKRVFILFY